MTGCSRPPASMRRSSCYRRARTHPTPRAPRSPPAPAPSWRVAATARSARGVGRRRIEHGARRAAARHAQSLREGRRHPARSRSGSGHGRRRPHPERSTSARSTAGRSSTTPRSASTPTSSSSARGCVSSATASGWRSCSPARAILRRYRRLVVRVEAPRQARGSGDGSERARTAFLFVGNNEYDVDGLTLGARARLDGGRLVAYLAPRVHARELPKLLRAGAGRARARAARARVNRRRRSSTSQRPGGGGCASPSTAK